PPTHPPSLHDALPIWYSFHPEPSRYPRTTHSTGMTSHPRQMVTRPRKFSRHSGVSPSAGRSSTSVESRCVSASRLSSMNLNHHRSEEHTSELQSPCNL